MKRLFILKRSFNFISDPFFSGMNERFQKSRVLSLTTLTLFNIVYVYSTSKSHPFLLLFLPLLPFIEIANHRLSPLTHVLITWLFYTTNPALIVLLCAFNNLSLNRNTIKKTHLENKSLLFKLKYALVDTIV